MTKLVLQDDGITEAEVQETLREKVRTLETYLVDIAHTVIKDSEQSTLDGESKTPPAVAFKYVSDSLNRHNAHSLI